MKGFVMINAEPGSEKAVYDALAQIRGVREVVPVYGETDFIAIADVDGINDLNMIVLRVREIHGVTSTETILGMELKF
ncbi:Lrp/AsnC ligand binding domain-containing protein [Methanotrichaceae archaeon M04Ac]|uniref:Lrp/AsnC ligand binding domain-containing protein n=1 Tax=Candidatus Methanocrinis alkalitolerans TaxID=3033395 RepID=A0ABT5XD47_9EURY|nr:Lrp/AsnC ligand binding domain-containing protein [Candidatus Methanocrinis alkalitolerans]MCR3884441.1 Lrp/AsnC ligand binding domain-containing protein [Methanothrix sp.]MDF0592585.1 Lrp/AsnC ligand binding domain-containing protein [Candidatus Methanocrinis alkalitolerans]